MSYDKDDLVHLHILDGYGNRWRYIFVDLARTIYCVYAEQPVSIELTKDQCRDKLAVALKTRCKSFKKFVGSQNQNLTGDAYLELAEPFAQYVVDDDWGEIQKCQ
jgi:hypothetical protein